MKAKLKKRFIEYAESKKIMKELKLPKVAPKLSKLTKEYFGLDKVIMPDKKFWLNMKNQNFYMWNGFSYLLSVAYHWRNVGIDVVFVPLVKDKINNVYWIDYMAVYGELFKKHDTDLPLIYIQIKMFDEHSFNMAMGQVDLQHYSLIGVYADYMKEFCKKSKGLLSWDGTQSKVIKYKFWNEKTTTDQYKKWPFFRDNWDRFFKFKPNNANIKLPRLEKILNDVKLKYTKHNVPKNKPFNYYDAESLRYYKPNDKPVCIILHNLHWKHVKIMIFNTTPNQRKKLNKDITIKMKGYDKKSDITYFRWKD